MSSQAFRKSSFFSASVPRKVAGSPSVPSTWTHRSRRASTWARPGYVPQSCLSRSSLAISSRVSVSQVRANCTKPSSSVGTSCLPDTSRRSARTPLSTPAGTLRRASTTTLSSERRLCRYSGSLASVASTLAPDTRTRAFWSCTSCATTPATSNSDQPYGTAWNASCRSFIVLGWWSCAATASTCATASQAWALGSPSPNRPLSVRMVRSCCSVWGWRCTRPRLEYTASMRLCAANSMRRLALSERPSVSSRPAT